MIFRSLLTAAHLALKVVLKIAGMRDPQFKKRLSERGFVLKIKTRNDPSGKIFHFEDGGLSGFPGMGEPDMVIEWASPKAALKAMNQRSVKGMADAMTNAVESGDLVVEVAAEPAFWFGTVMAGLEPAIRGTAGKK